MAVGKRSRNGDDGDDDGSITAADIGEVVRDIKDMVGASSSNDGGGGMKRFLKDLSRAPAPKQLGVGAAVGWVAGYATMKVGKMAATAIGGSLLLLQIAHYKGYVKVNWNRVSRDASTLGDRVKDKLRLKSRSGAEKVLDFARDNVYVAGGFAGGFFLGIASS